MNGNKLRILKDAYLLTVLVHRFLTCWLTLITSSKQSVFNSFSSLISPVVITGTSVMKCSLRVLLIWILETDVRNVFHTFVFYNLSLKNLQQMSISKISVRRRIRTAKFPMSKSPYSEGSLRRSILTMTRPTSKFSYGEML